jgi:hypothetical protein
MAGGESKENDKLRSHRAAVAGKVVASLLLLVFVAATALLLGFGLRSPRCASVLEKRASELGFYARQMAVAEQKERLTLDAAGPTVAESSVREESDPLGASKRASYLVGATALAASDLSRCIGTAMSQAGWMGFGAGFFAALAVSSIVALIRWTHASKATVANST